jgi:Rod binding domain-containing protein
MDNAFHLASPVAIHQMIGMRPVSTQKVPADLASVDPKLLASSRAAAEDFEAFFVTHSFADMMGDMQPDALFGGGEGESVFRSFLLDEYGKMVAKTQGIGVADAVQRELLHLQEAPKK